MPDHLSEADLSCPSLTCFACVRENPTTQGLRDKAQRRAAGQCQSLPQPCLEVRDTGMGTGADLPGGPHSGAQILQNLHQSFVLEGGCLSLANTKGADAPFLITKDYKFKFSKEALPTTPWCWHSPLPCSLC